MVPHPDLEIRIWVEVPFFGSDDKLEFWMYHSWSNDRVRICSTTGSYNFVNPLRLEIIQLFYEKKVICLIFWTYDEQFTKAEIQMKVCLKIQYSAV